MPKNPFDWHAKTFQDANYWRNEAKKWDDLASLADKDGDTHHADNARRNAAQCRQNARLQEVDGRPA